MKSVCRVTEPGKGNDIGRRGLGEWPDMEPLVEKLALVRALIPIGLQAVQELLDAEVVRLAGEHHQRTRRQSARVRLGQEPGAIDLADRKLPVAHTRVRDRQRN